MNEPDPKLTRWQQRARRRDRDYRRWMNVLFGLLMAAALVYFAALAHLVAPEFTR